MLSRSLCEVSLILSLLASALPEQAARPAAASQHFAFVDHQLIFTLELFDGVPIFNFVNITDQEYDLLPRHIELYAEGRRLLPRFFVIDTGVEGQQVTAPSIRMRGRSSFGFSLKGDFQRLEKLNKVIVRLGKEFFELAPLSRDDFDFLAKKINNVNLNSPDIRDDFRVLRIDHIGTRTRKE